NDIAVNTVRVLYAWFLSVDFLFTASKSNKRLQQEFRDLVALRLENFFEINTNFEKINRNIYKYIMVTKKDVDVLTLCDFKGLKRDTTQDDLHKRETVEIVKYFHEKWISPCLSSVA
ncbi:4901_t:CDS:2, partial [Gigaspora margarita]